RRPRPPARGLARGRWVAGARRADANPGRLLHPVAATSPRRRRTGCNGPETPPQRSPAQNPPVRWSRGHTSGIEDRRSQGDSGGFGGFGMGGGGRGMSIPVGVGGTGGLIILILFIALQVLGSSGGAGALGAALDPYGGQVAEPVGTPDLTNN